MNSTFPIHTTDTAPVAAQDTLRNAQKAFGFLPNLLGGLANAPVALHAYLALAESFSKSSLTPAEQQVVAISVSTENECEYCVAAHSVMAGRLLGNSEITALRSEVSTGSARIDALAVFTRAVVAKRGWVDAADLAAFEAGGFDRAQALEVIVGVAQKTLSNYANHLIGTPLDHAFDPARWVRSAEHAA